jgi:integrase/recombinase XerD
MQSCGLDSLTCLQSSKYNSCIDNSRRWILQTPHIRKINSDRLTRARQARDYQHCEKAASERRRQELLEHEAWLSGLSPSELGARPKPRGGRARTLNLDQLERVLAYIDKHSSCPESDRLKMELSFHAGLRACEIAGLRLRDVTDAEGAISNEIHVREEISKGRRERSVPMHPRIKAALEAFRQRYPYLDSFAVSHRGRAPRIQSTNALTVWFHSIFKQAGFEGCSSHSGRRTFITQLARRSNHFNGSLRDVQIAAGHARLDTTAAYIDPGETLAEMIHSLSTELPASSNYRHVGSAQ